MSSSKNRRTLEASVSTRQDRAAILSLLVEVGLTFVLVAGVFLMLGLVSYEGLDPDGLPLQGGWTGPAGTYLAFALYQLVGHAGLLVPVLLVVASVTSLVRKTSFFGPLRMLGSVTGIVLASALMHVGWAGELVLGGHLAGGATGALLGDWMKGLFAGPGSFLLLTAGLCMAAVLVSGLGPRAFSRVLLAMTMAAGRRAIAIVQRAGRSALGLVSRITRRASSATIVIDPVLSMPIEDREDDGGEALGGDPDEDDAGAETLTPVIHHHLDPKTEVAPTRPNGRPAGKRGAAAPAPSVFTLPPLSMLERPIVQESNVSHEELGAELTAMASRLSETLENYGVKGKVTDIHPGPVVTTLEMRPEKGTKVSTISRLSDDLAMSLEVTRVRIVAPIPGKNAVGFELPSPLRQPVLLSEIMDDPRFSLESARIPLAVGKDIIGNPYIMDLSRMPHLLIAGTTGSGKSVAINTLLMSLLFKFTPDDMRLILVDPKMVELQPYDGIPHLYLPVVTDMKHAASALRWAVDEMERRYHMFSDLNVRDIRGYNRKVEKLLAGAPVLQPDTGTMDPDDPGTKEALQHERLPYVVIVIDEFADLMMTSARDVENAVSRLAAKARAAGIHLIVATQRPSVNVVTGLIKSNFPCRIAFKVASKVDSRVMLDANGAECLLGLGDMLILPPGQSDLLRMHGGFVSDEEIQRVTDHWRSQADPSYKEEILRAGEDEEGALQVDDEDADPRYVDAVAIATSEGKVSISYLQRKLKIGYNRAARIVERMETDGIVGPAIPGKSHREVLRSAPAA